jgi:hypothetical protein
MTFLKRFMLFFDFILPFPLFAAMFYLWYLRVGHNWFFASFVLVLPLVWGYVVPGIGTNILKMWRFEGRWKMGNYHIHHGFMYAGPLALILYCTFGAGPVSTLQAITIILCTAAAQGFFSSQHDVMAIKAGHLFIDNPPARAGKSAEEIVNYLSPFYFFLLGVTYAAACIYAYNKTFSHHWHTFEEFIILLAVGLTLMSVVPSVTSLIILYIKKK